MFSLLVLNLGKEPGKGPAHTPPPFNQPSGEVPQYDLRSQSLQRELEQGTEIRGSSAPCDHGSLLQKHCANSVTTQVFGVYLRLWAHRGIHSGSGAGVG